MIKKGIKLRYLKNCNEGKKLVKKDVKQIIKDICVNQCKAKCCKTSLELPAHAIPFYPGDFTNFVEKGYSACLGETTLEGIWQPIIRPHIFGYCPLLNPTTNECLIYDERPLGCKVFPFEHKYEHRIRNDCILYAKTKKEKRTALEIRHYKQFSHYRYHQKYEIDQTVFQTTYQSILDETLGMDNPKLIKNDYGSFAFISKEINSNTIYLHKLCSLIKSYSTYFSLKQIIINVLVADTDYHPVCHIKGIYGYFENISMLDLLNKTMYVQSIYFTDLNDGTLLEGVIFTHELDYDHSFWTDIWNQHKKNYQDWKK